MEKGRLVVFYQRQSQSFMSHALLDYIDRTKLIVCLIYDQFVQVKLIMTETFSLKERNEIFTIYVIINI